MPHPQQDCSATEARVNRNDVLSQWKDPFLTSSAVEYKKLQMPNDVGWQVAKDLSVYGSHHATWGRESPAHFTSQPISLPQAKWLLSVAKTTHHFVKLVSNKPSNKETNQKPACRTAMAGMGVGSVVSLSLNSCCFFLATSLAAYNK